MSGLCKDCRHWAHNDGEAWGLCIYGEHYVSGRAERKPRMYSVDPGVRSMVHTASDFGCVQFEERD